MSLAASSQPPTLLSRLRLAAADIKLAHSVFALPFAILGAFLARAPATLTQPHPGPGWATFAAQLALIIVCMVFARTWAMLINRLADRDIDAANPRTSRRVIASGKLSVPDARLITLGCALAFCATCSVFFFAFANPWPLILAIPVLLWIAFYSYTKRFTFLCHVFLGGALAASPLAAAIAIDPSALARTPALYFLAGMVLCWVAGFDVIYALQDTDFDRQTGLHSIPSRLGPTAAIWISRALHVGAFSLLILAAASEPRFGPVFFAAVALVGGLLIAEHVILAKRGKAGLDMAFFTVNGIVSCVLGLAGVVDIAVI